MRTSPSVAIVAAIALVAPAALAGGPGAPKNVFTDDELFKVVSRIDGPLGAPRGHGSIFMHQGYLMIVSADDGETMGSIQFFDVSDAKHPKLVARREDDVTHELRECHGPAFTRFEGRDLVALQSKKGFQIWDITDVFSVDKIADVALPGVDDTNYGAGVWWMAWQGRTLYAGGSNVGLYLVDTTDPKNPKLLDRKGKKNPIPQSELGSFRPGPVFAIGNLLIATSMDQRGFASFDASDPRDPKLLYTTKTELPAWYAPTVNGKRLFGAGIHDGLVIVDLSNPGKPVTLSTNKTDRGGYVTLQDDRAFMGASSYAAVFDISDQTSTKLIAQVAGTEGGDKDFATPISNVAFIGDDHGHGTFLVPHQNQPDTTPPKVTMVSPDPSTTGRARTSRVGLTFSDSIDMASIDATTVKVRKKGGAALAGRYTHAFAIVNFEPDAELEADTTYEIVVEKGGVRDWSGNAIAETFVSTFTTGSALAGDDVCKQGKLPPRAVGEAISFDASSLATPPPGATFAWDFGDGTEQKAGPDAVAQHTYARPGHVQVILRVKSGETESACAAVQTVHRALSARSPVSSSTLAVDAPRGVLWTVDQDHGAVSRLDLATGAVQAEVHVGKDPRSLSLLPSGDVLVTVQGDDLVVRVSGDRVASSVALPRGSQPIGIVADEARALVTLQATGRLVELTHAPAVVRSVAVGPTPRGLGVTSDGRVLVSRFVSPVDHGEVSVLSADLVPSTPLVLAYDTSIDTGDSGAGVPNYLGAPGLSRDAAAAFVTAKKDNVLRGGLHEEPAPTFESTVRPMVAFFDLTTGQEDPLLRKDLNDMALPMVALPTSLGDYVFVANAASRAVTVLDAYDSQTVSILSDTGAVPVGLALDEAAGRLYVHHFLGRDVAVYDVSGILASTDFAPPRIATFQTNAKEVLAEPILRGKKLFYDAKDPRIGKDDYLACASCHFDGDHDGRTWDFFDRGEGLRNTISLLGRRGTGHGPVHWTANFDEIQDFENDLRNAFSGKGLMSDQDFAECQDPLGPRKAGKSPDLDALAAYVTTLADTPKSPYRNADGSLTDAARRGRDRFRALGCPSCHGGPDYTVSAAGKRFDVGTIGHDSGLRRGGPIDGLDVPTLKGLWQSAPYLHDGSAPTLRAVLVDRNGEGKHGATNTLDGAALDELEAYLSSIDDTVDEDAPDTEIEGGCVESAHGPGSPLGAMLLAALGWLGRARRRRGPS